MLLDEPSLMFRPRIRADESFAGYLLRLIDANCLSGTPELLGALGQRLGRTNVPSYLPQFGVYFLEVMADVLRHSVAELEIHCHQLDSPTGRSRRFFHDGLKWPLSAFRHKYRAWCPQCMANDPMHHRDWDLRMITVCFKHKSLLAERCPECGQTVPWRNCRLNTCRCGGLLSRAKTIPIAMNDGCEVVNFSNDPEHRMRAITLLLLDHPETIGRFDWVLLEKYDQVALTEKLIMYSSSISGKDDFYLAVDRLLDMRLVEFPSVGPRFAVCPLLHGLSVDDKFDDMLREHALVWLSKQHWNVEKIPSHVIDYGEKVILPGDAAAILNISIHIVGQLIKHKLLRILAQRTHTTGVGRKITLNGLHEFMARLALSMPPDKTIEVKQISYVQFGLDFEPRMYLLSRVIAQQAWVAAYDAAYGLPSLIVAVPVEKEIKRNGLTVAEVASRLGIYTDAVYRVAHAGFLKHTRHEKRQLRISDEDFMEFNRRYVFVRELAQKVKCNPTNLADKLRSAGIEPIHGPSIDDGLVYLFRRNDIVNVDLDKIICDPKYTSTAGRRRVSHC